MNLREWNSQRPKKTVGNIEEETKKNYGRSIEIDLSLLNIEF